MSSQAETAPRSVLSSLYHLLGSLESTFPSSSSETLHPFRSQSSDVIRKREQALQEVGTLRTSLENFRSSWIAEKDVVDAQFSKPDTTGQGTRDLDSELERRKAGVARVMMDWCNHESLLLSASSAISKLETRAASRTRNPFVHAQTLVSPTERLQAVAVSIPLDVYLNNEDPDLGNATDQPGNVRTDTLSFGGERMAIDMDIKHPRWEAEPSGSRRYQMDDGWQVAKCEVSYFPLGSEVAEPVVLLRMSEVLSAYLARYIGIVNTYQLEQLALFNSDDDDSVLSIPFEDENDSFALQAERVIVAFRENVAQIAMLDKRMKKVEFEATSAEPLTPRPLTTERAERNWFVEAEEMGRLIDGTNADISNAPAPTLRHVFPVFVLAPSEGSPSPTGCLKPLPKSHGPVVQSPLAERPASGDQSMDVDQDAGEVARLDSSGWMLEIEPEILVGQDVFWTGTDGHVSQASSLPEGKDISALLLPETISTNDLSWTYRPTVPGRRNHRYISTASGIPGFRVSRFPLHQAFTLGGSEVESVKQALERSLWLNRLHRSCFKPSMRSGSPPVDDDRKDLDAELEVLMSGGTLPHSQLAVTVQRIPGSLQLSFPLPLRHGADRALQMLVVNITPLRTIVSEADFEITFEALPASGITEKNADIDMARAKSELVKARFDVPRWLEWMDLVIRRKSNEIE